MDFDLTAHLAEIAQYQRDVNALFEATPGGADSPEWAQTCAELAEWNAAVAAERTRP